MIISESLRQLLEKSGVANLPVSGRVLGCSLGLIAPFVVWTLSGILSCLVAARLSSDQPEAFSLWLPNAAEQFSEDTSLLWRVTVLLVIAIGAVALASLLLHLFYRSVHRASLAFEVGLMEALRKHADKLARLRTLSAHQQALADSLEFHLPRVQAALAQYWRAFPRHALQASASILLAFALDPMLGALALIAAGFLILVYRFLDGSRRTQLPVIRERAAWNRAQIVELSLRGPLLESAHEFGDLESRFNSKSQNYRADAFLELTSSIWKSSVMLFLCGILAGTFFFVVSVTVFRANSGLGASGACCFVLLCLTAAISSSRMWNASALMRTIETATDELGSFLGQVVEELATESTRNLEAVTQSAELEYVTVLDSRGRKLLENVTASFSTGKLVGVVADQHLQARALVELLLGFGRPVSGRMLVDGVSVTDLHPESLVRCGHWVASDGALAAGTLRQNLLRGSDALADFDTVEEALSDFHILPFARRLPEGMDTIVSSGDDRLSSDVAFRIGMARAAMSSASVVVLEEPEGVPYDREAESMTLNAMQKLVSMNRITLVLPQRLATLQHCDEVMMLHEHRVADVGSHSELIRRNELYRHLNYLKFNPFGEV